MSKEVLKRYAQSSCKGLLINNSPKETGICHGCELGKSHHLPFPPSNKCASQLLELVHSDLVGPLQSNSIQGNKYFATFINDYTRIVVVIPLKSKDQLSGAFVHYWHWAERQLEHYKLKCLHSDHGGKYVNKEVKTLLLQVGIEHKLTVLHSPQQNGRAECFNRTIMEKGTSMLHDAGLSLGFWEQAVMTAVYIYNRTPIHSTKWKTLYELWCDTVPDVAHFKVFGCKAYFHVSEHNQHKLDPKSKEAVFVGYEPDTKGYTLWDRHSRSFIISRDVTFDEETFPSCSDLGNQRPPLIPLPSSSIPTGESFNYPVDVIIPGEPAQPSPALPQLPQAPQSQEDQPSEEAPEPSAQEDRPHTPPNLPPLEPQTEYHTPPTCPTATSPPAHCPNTHSSCHPRSINPIPLPAFTPLEQNSNRESPVDLPAMPDLRHSTRNQ